MLLNFECYKFSGWNWKFLFLLPFQNGFCLVSPTHSFCVWMTVAGLFAVLKNGRGAIMARKQMIYLNETTCSFDCSCSVRIHMHFCPWQWFVLSAYSIFTFQTSLDDCKQMLKNFHALRKKTTSIFNHSYMKHKCTEGKCACRAG